MRTRAMLFFAIFLAAGCGGPKIAPVSGKVTMDGKPLANANVNFQPIGQGNVHPGPGSHSKADKNGEYTLEYIEGGQGALVSKHRVEISAIADDGKGDPEDNRRRAAPDRVPPQFNVKSQLTCDAPPGGKNDANFALTSR